MTKKFLLLVSFILICFSSATFLSAQTSRTPHAEISITPSSASFQEGSTFEVPIFINTEGNSINAIELHIAFDPDKLSIIRPTGGKSIIGLWMEPPSYDNSKGTAKVVGAIPNGITSDSGLIVTITFKAKATGQTVVSIRDDSNILLNNGLGTRIAFEANRGNYTIVPKPPEGVQVFSETHPFQDRWYNNNNPVITWAKDPGVTGFSFILDSKPNTIPGNTATTEDTIKAYEDLSDGPWYFHIKALRHGVWGSTAHFMVRIDTEPPAEFTPNIDFLSAAVINRFLVTFFTTDSLSGLDHYEVGVIDKTKPATESPVFVQTESPYQLPFNATDNARVIVRAVDKAGNVRDESADVAVPFFPLKLITDNAIAILLSLLALFILLFIINYLVGHKVIRKLRNVFALLKREEKLEIIKTAEDIVEQEEAKEDTPPAIQSPDNINIENISLNTPEVSELEEQNKK